MAKRRQPNETSSHRRAGVYIEGSQVSVGADLVGRDKITIGENDGGLQALFTRLEAAIQASDSLAPDEKPALTAVSEELKTELQQPEPDLGKIGRIKQALSEHGGDIAAAATAIFQYPAVQDAIKTMTQRLLGA